MRDIAVSRRAFLASTAAAAIAAAPGAALGATTNADLLITGVTIATFDDKRTVIADGAIAIRGTKIVWAGPTAQAAKYTAPTTIDGRGLVAMPGLTNTHFHAARHFLHGGPSQGRLHAWNAGRKAAALAVAITPDEVYASALAGYAALIRSGTTCALDAGGPHPDQVARAAGDIGIRARVALGVADLDPIGELPPAYLTATRDALSRSAALVRRYDREARVSAWLAYDGVARSTEALRKGMDDLSKQLGVPIHIRVGATTGEIGYTVIAYNQRPVGYLDSQGLLSNRLHCAGAALLSPQEVELFAKHGVTTAHAPSSDYRAGAFRYLEMLKTGIAAGIASDGDTPGASPDLFEAVRMAALGQTMFYAMLQYSTEAVSEEDVLFAAVRRGAAAARLTGRTGTIQAGSIADVILLDLDTAPHAAGDTMKMLAQHASGSKVRTSIIDGALVLHDGHIKTMDPMLTRTIIDKSYEGLMGRLGPKLAAI